MTQKQIIKKKKKIYRKFFDISCLFFVFAFTIRLHALLLPQNKLLTVIQQCLCGFFFNSVLLFSDVFSIVHGFTKGLLHTSTRYPLCIHLFPLYFSYTHTHTHFMSLPYIHALVCEGIVYTLKFSIFHFFKDFLAWTKTDFRLLLLGVRKNLRKIRKKQLQNNIFLQTVKTVLSRNFMHSKINSFTFWVPRHMVGILGNYIELT